MQLAVPSGFIGQGNLTQSLPNFINKDGFDSPVSVAIDPAQHVYVADWNNSRVLGWVSASAFTNGSLAQIEVGEPDPGANDGCVLPPSNATLCHPSGVAADSNSHLFVADSGNNRVLEFSSPFTNINADNVFGTCGDFNGEGAGCTGGTSAATLNNPSAVAIDAGNNLWVLDAGNNRIVEYANPLVGGSITVATVVLGQLGSFSSKSCNLGASPTADSLCFTGFAAGLMFNSGNLFVSDSGNNRVLEFLSPAQGGTSPGTPGTPGDSTADTVFGENGSFTASNFQTSNGESAGTLLTPGGIALDASGDLFIADQGNQRVLEYASPLDPSGGASLVLGQCGSFNSTGCPAPATIQAGLEETLNFALVPAGGSNLAGGLAFDAAGDLYVADVANNRVLALTPPLGASTAQFSVESRVLGQASTAHNSLNLINGTGYSMPWGVALDQSVSPNRLYIVDSNNSRLLAYKNVTSINNLHPADAVFGQPDFFSYYPNQFDSTGSTAPSAGTLAFPTAALVDSAGNLYVADSGNSRVLIFLNPIGLGAAVGFNANFVIGQNGSFTTGYTSAACPAQPSATTLCGPNGLALDASGDLYIVDAGWNRVLEFTSPTTSPSLVKVFGQPDATTFHACSMSDPTAICSPNGGIGFDVSGRMYVDGAGAGTGIGIYNSPAVESSPDAVMPARAFAIAFSLGNMFLSQGDSFQAGSSTLVEYSPPFTSSSTPSNVFGPDFTLNQIPALSNSLGLGFDSSHILYLADSGNNRALIFQNLGATPTPTRTATPTKTPIPKKTPTATPTATPTPANGFASVSPKKLTLNASPMATASASITITNTGVGPLTVSVSPLRHSPPLTEIGGGNGIVIDPGKVHTVTVVFSPTRKGSTKDQILIGADDPKQKKPIKVKIKAKSK